MQLKYNSVKTTLDINVISGYSKTRSRLLKNLNNKPDKAKLKSLNGYDAIGEKLGENNLQIVKTQNYLLKGIPKDAAPHVRLKQSFR